MEDITYLSETVRKLYQIVDQLEDVCAEHERHFTLDGHLLGSIGEVYAAETYGIDLFKSSAEAHDGVTMDGTERLVQIKVTQTRSKKQCIGISHKPDYLLVLLVHEDGTFEEVYNGPGANVWESFDTKKRPSNGQYQISLSKLKRLDASIDGAERIRCKTPVL